MVSLLIIKMGSKLLIDTWKMNDMNEQCDCL